MKLPRAWWLVLPALGVLAALVAPLVYEQRHIPEALHAPALADDPSVEHDLACAIEAACGPLRALVTLTLRANAEPEVSPPDALPPGYAGCAARVAGGQLAGTFTLAPCDAR